MADANQATIGSRKVAGHEKREDLVLREQVQNVYISEQSDRYATPIEHVNEPVSVAGGEAAIIKLCEIGETKLYFTLGYLNLKVPSAVTNLHVEHNGKE